jgi:hypothetical protein
MTLDGGCDTDLFVMNRCETVGGIHVLEDTNIFLWRLEMRFFKKK